MDERKYALLGVFAPLTAYLSVSLSILSSQWFSWRSNALSDLGHAVNSGVAPVFNFGLLLTGFFTIVYSIKAMRKHAKYTGCCLLISGFLLQLIATFNEVYGYLHYLVSVLFFVSLGSASIIYAIERKSLLVVIAFVVGLSSWVLYWFEVYNAGIAVPEIISSLAVASWLIESALRMFFSRVKKNRNSN